MPALSLKLPIPILWVFFVLLFRLIFPIKEQKWLRHVLLYVTFLETPEISAATAFVLSACVADLSLVSVSVCFYCD